MLEEKLSNYKKKYYLNLLIRGSIFALIAWLIYFSAINILVFIGFDSTPVRSFFFFSALLLFGASFFFWVLSPFLKMFVKSHQISDTQAASSIGQSFPFIKDKLLNTLQLYDAYQGKNSSLLKASLDQRSLDFQEIDFSTSINLNINVRFLYYLLPIIGVIGLIWISKPQVFSDSTEKVINYSKEYLPQAPFQVTLDNSELSAFKGDDYLVAVSVAGEKTPKDIFIDVGNGSRIKMVAGESGQFQYTFRKIQKSVDFRFFASGFYTEEYALEVFNRPSLSGFSIYLDYPAYTKKVDERIDNNGNITVPEGTKVNWQIETRYAKDVSFSFLEGTAIEPEANGSNRFSLSKTFKNSTGYSVSLKNEYTTNKDSIGYQINVIPDKKPALSIQHYADTVTFSSLMVGGNVSDDYGISRLDLFYRITNSNASDDLDKKEGFKKMNLKFSPASSSQDYLQLLNLDSLNLKNGQQLLFYVEAWDNDQVNGAKRTASSVQKFNLPSKKELTEKAENSTKEAKGQLDKSLDKSKELSEEIDKIKDQLKGKKTLSWQDKKALENLSKKREDLEKDIKDLQKKFDTFRKQNQNIDLEENEKVVQKAQQLQQLLDQVLDEETKKLYDELQKLLEKNFINNDLQESLEDMSMQQENLENELDRSLKLFKQLKFDLKTEQLAKELEELSEKQKDLSKQEEDPSENSDNEEGDNTEDQGGGNEEDEGESDSSDGNESDQNQKEEEAQKSLEEQQGQLNKESESLQEQLEELEQLGEELNKSSDDLEQTEQDLEDAQEMQQQASEMLKQGDQKGAQKQQRKASKKMKDAAQKLQQMSQSGEMTMIEENYDDLRAILENLIKLSFDQENLIGEFKRIKRVDPKFVELSQQQLKLQDDARTVEDSLIALSKRVFVIESFVTREVTLMNKYMDQSIDAIRKRVPEVAASKQQFTMTSINNLALMLDDILKQMQENMSQAKGGTQMSKKKGGSPSLSQLQKQLNSQIQKLKKSGKSGQQLSRELAKLAAEQEKIRNAMKQAMQGQGSGSPNGDPLNPNPQGGQKGENGEKMGKDGDQGKRYQELLEMMESTEEDLVNKRLTQKTLQRQKEIITRLLESEKADRERKMDKERESKSAEQIENTFKDQVLKEYFKEKKSQIELLKTLPPNLNLYYKNQIDQYFKD